MPSVAPIPKNLLNQARRNYERMKQNKRNKLTQKLRAVRRAEENKKHVEEEFAKLQARLNALTCKSPKKTKSSSNFVNVSSNNLKGYKKSSKKTKRRSTTLNRIKRMTKKASNALTRK